MECKHTITNGEGVCIDCGTQCLSTETRVCGACKHYRPAYASAKVGSCMRHLMLVTWDLKVTYHTAEGTCFEEDPQL